MPNPIVKARLLRSWDMIDGEKERVAPSPSDSHRVAVEAGEYELEVIRNPRPGYSNPWFVLPRAPRSAGRVVPGWTGATAR